jgi:hypothetical protein
MINYGLLVYLGLIPPCRGDHFRGFVFGERLLTRLETRRLRIADAALVGLLALFGTRAKQ